MRLNSLYAFSGFLAVTLAASNSNPFTLPAGFSVTAGKPTTLTWTPTTPGTVTLRLREGASNNLDKGTLIQANIPNNGKFTYTPDANTVRNSDYTIEIVSDSDPTQTNYSAYFVVNSDNTVASVSSLSGTPSAASSTAASTGSSSASGSTTSTKASKASAASTSASKAKASATKSTKAAKSTGASKSSAPVASGGGASVTAAPGTAPSSAADVLGSSKAQYGLMAILAAAVAAW